MRLSWGSYSIVVFFFFFQAEDGIRDTSVTGVQTCALPICHSSHDGPRGVLRGRAVAQDLFDRAGKPRRKIGRASCRERVWSSGGAGAVKKKEKDAVVRGGVEIG